MKQSANVIVYTAWGKRTKFISRCMYDGIKRYDSSVRYLEESEYKGPDAPVAVFYSLREKLWDIFNTYRTTPGLTAVYVDLGYWGRKLGGQLEGYHKVSVNARHPTAYFQRVQHDERRRLTEFGIRFGKFRKGGKHILLAGMGDKAAAAEGYRPEEYERLAIAELRKYTDRKIIYRPKPSWQQAMPIDGTEFSNCKQDLSEVLADCYCIVTHHSNVGVDGVIQGIPVITQEGVATVMGREHFSQINDLLYPEEGREQWVNDICYTQWRPSEMRAGHCWRYLKEEGLVP